MSYCGECCYLIGEDTDGFGICRPYNLEKYCGDCSCSKFVSTAQKRHYLAVLVQANRYRRDEHVPSIYRMPNPVEFGKAIDFVVEFAKKF